MAGDLLAKAEQSYSIRDFQTAKPLYEQSLALYRDVQNSRSVAHILLRLGKIAYKVQPFRVLAADAYTELGDAIDKLSPPPSPSDK